MARTKQERLASVHTESLAEFDIIQSALRDERLQCLQDRRFYSLAGAQWEGPLQDQYENKPKFEVNKCHLAVIRIFNEYRNNRVNCTFLSNDGGKSDATAELATDLFRADENASCAEEAYDNAFEEGVGGGFGAWRVRAEYVDDADEDSDHQTIKIEPIFDADTSVFYDLDAKRQDKSDAKSCYVLTAMTRDAYIDTYNDDPSSWPKGVSNAMFDWATPDVVYIAEVYKIEEKSDLIRIFKNPMDEEKKYRSADFENDELLEETLKATGWYEARRKKVKVKKCHKYLMSGGKVLEDCGIIAGNNIPVIPFYAKRWYVDNIERCMGHVRLAKDPQRLKNMQLSKLGEISALSSISKPIMTPEQVNGHAVMWSEDNIKNFPYLLVNPLKDANGNPAVIGPASYTKAPEIPPAMAALLQITEQDMQEILGNQQQADELLSGTSGKAVELVQTRLDMQSFIYISNLAKSKKRTMDVWLSMAKDIYVEEGREVTGISNSGAMAQYKLMQPSLDDSGNVVMDNDLSTAKIVSDVEIGPSSSSKRQATVRGLTGMMAITQDPETMKVLGAMAMMNMEGEGISDVRAYFRGQLVRMGVIKPTAEEAKELQTEAENQKPSANDQYLQAEAGYAQAKAEESQANAALTVTKIAETQAKTAETKARTAETISRIDLTERSAILGELDKIEQVNPPAM